MTGHPGMTGRLVSAEDALSALLAHDADQLSLEEEVDLRVALERLQRIRRRPW